MSETKRLAIKQIRLDGGTQTRADINSFVVDEYAEAIRAGATFPAVVVFYDGSEHWLADGFHRANATLAAGLAEIECDVRQGDRRAAILHSVGANASHGIQRKNTDKRRAVETLLNDPEWSQWSDREIARRCAVTHPFVLKIRSENASGNGYQIAEGEERKATRGGTTYTIDTTNIGKSKPAEITGPDQDEARRSLRECLDSPATHDPEPAQPTRRNAKAARQVEAFDASEDDGEDYEQSGSAPIALVPVKGEAAPVPVRAFFEEPRQWGDVESLNASVMIHAVHKRFQDELRAAFARVDPRFVLDVRRRTEDAALRSVIAIQETTPTTVSTPKFGVITGGKS